MAVMLKGTDPEGDPLTYAIVGQPAHGSLTGTGANRTYTPAAGYHGPDSFTFTVADGERWGIIGRNGAGIRYPATHDQRRNPRDMR